MAIGIRCYGASDVILGTTDKKDTSSQHTPLMRGCKAVGPGVLVYISIQLLGPAASLASLCVVNRIQSVHCKFVRIKVYCRGWGQASTT